MIRDLNLKPFTPKPMNPSLPSNLSGVPRKLVCPLVTRSAVGILLGAGMVRGDPTSDNDYTAWQQAHFLPAELGDPGLENSIWGDQADPDGDGCPNLVEFMMVRDPRVADAPLGLRCRIEGDDVVMTYRETTTGNPGVHWKVEWSVDAGFWVVAGVRYQTLETHADHRIREARITRNREVTMLVRLSASR